MHFKKELVILKTLFFLFRVLQTDLYVLWTGKEKKEVISSDPWSTSPKFTHSLFLFVCLFSFWDRISWVLRNSLTLGSQGWPWISHLPVTVSWELELQTCAPCLVYVPGDRRQDFAGYQVLYQLNHILVSKTSIQFSMTSSPSPSKHSAYWI